jgi:molecular chaperone GrpE
VDALSEIEESATSRLLEDTSAPGSEARDELEEWRERAARLQADMAGFRQRQQRFAQDQIEAERQRLLSSFLGVVDNLERALDAPVEDGPGLRQGVELTRRVALQLLQQEGVERLRAEGQAFDPHWHEAIATRGRNGSTNGDHAAPDTVIQVMEPGYRLGERLLRPAKVIVSV